MDWKETQQEFDEFGLPKKPMANREEDFKKANKLEIIGMLMVIICVTFIIMLICLPFSCITLPLGTLFIIIGIIGNVIFFKGAAIDNKHFFDY